MKEEMGIIQNIQVGMRDTNQVVCWFTVQILNGHSLQIISLQEMQKLILESQVYKLEDLNNKPCICETNTNMVKFKRIL